VTVKEEGGRKGGWGVQYIANQGQGWTSIRTTMQEGDFQVSKRVNLLGRQKGLEKGLATEKDSQGVLRTCAFDMYICTSKSCV
jgi:hypothetical protein